THVPPSVHLYFFPSSSHPPDLHSFPTRRSSDLHTYATLPYASAAAFPIIAFLYPFQMYADFSGYTDIALGAAFVLGIKLSENFEDRKSTRLNSSHQIISYVVLRLKTKSDVHDPG